MNNLKSYTEYAVTTPTTDFVIGFDFNYGTDAVNVTVDGVPATEAGYSVIYLNSTTMRLSPAVPTGVVRLQRETDIDVPDNQFTAGAKFIASNMDENFTQIRHAQQEVRDGFSKLKDDIGSTNLEQTIQAVHTIANEVEDNVTESRTLLSDTTDQAVLAQDYANSANSANNAAQQAATDAQQAATDAQQAVIDVSTAEADVYSALSAQQTAVNNSLTAIAGGHKAYQTLADAQAAQASLPVNSVVEVTNDGANNGTYQWNGTTLTKSDYDPLTQAKDFANANPMFKAVAVVAGDNVNNFTTSGMYTLSANLPEGQLTNWPLTNNGYHISGILVVYGVQIYGGVKLASQIFYPYVDRYEPLFRANSFSDGTWSENWRTLTLDLISNMSRASSTVNMLDPKKVLQGYEVRSDGTILASATAAISGLIYCFDKESIYVSGLQVNTNQRWYRFLRQDGSIISAGTIRGSTTEKLINVPSGAYSFQVSLKQGNSAPLDISTAQIELGGSKSAYVPFSDGAITHIKDVALATSSVSLNDVAFGKNLFNKNTVINGYEVYNTGNLLAQANSITTAPMRVRGLSLVTVSGLLQNPEIERYGAFRDKFGSLLSIVQIARTSTQETIPVPINAETFQFSIKQRSTSSPDLNVIQVESGSNATEYESYIKGFDSLNGVPISVSGGNSEGRSSRAYGAKYLMFGDSITQTGDVDNGDITGTTFRSNWPKFAKDQLSMSGYKNYARSGASFREYAGQLTWQKISHQVQTAITNAENPDIIVLACGTNDANINLGNYTTAMSKTIAELDMSNTAEAMRWSLFKIKENFPNAVCFYCTQLQRADSEMESRLDANNLMVKMAQRYGFNIIDCMTESGIVRDFEVDAEARRYLYDGLHPNVDGQKLQSNLIVSRIVERMSF